LNDDNHGTVGAFRYVTATVAEVMNTQAKLGRRVVKEDFILKVHPANIFDAPFIYDHSV